MHQQGRDAGERSSATISSYAHPAGALASDRKLWCDQHGDLTEASACTAFFTDLDSRFETAWAEERETSVASRERLDLSGEDLRRASAQSASLVGANLSEARLEGAYLGEARLEGANLWQARLEGAYPEVRWYLLSDGLNGAPVDTVFAERAMGR